MVNHQPTKTAYVFLLTDHQKSKIYVGSTQKSANKIFHQSHYIDKTTYTNPEIFFSHFLIYFESFETEQEAQARELEIKSWTLEQKQALVSEFNPNWYFLDNII